MKERMNSFFSHNARWLSPSSPSARLRLPPLSAFRPQSLSRPRLLNAYLQLSKPRLTALVVLTAMSGVALSPSPASLPILLSTAMGTALSSASANALNQLQEVPFDAQMARTRARPLVRRAISPLHATGFALFTGIAGPALLWTMVNPTTAILGFSNIVLYAGVYTWMKRKSPFNTWVGSVVGVLPPLMGWAACDPGVISSLHLSAELLPPLTLSMLLFSWQFPHFNALSHLVRGSYAQAGYRMLCVTNPTHNALVSLRHALLLIPVCSVLAPLSGLTTWTFAVSALFPNLILTRAAWRFWKGGAESDAKVVFHHSLWYLPVILALMMLHKQGTDWSRWIDRTILGKDDDVEQ